MSIRANAEYLRALSNPEGINQYSRGASAAIRTARTPQFQGALSSKTAGKKFPQGEKDAAKGHYDAIHAQLTAEGFSSERAGWVNSDIGSNHATTLIHPSGESFKLERNYFGTIPGDRAKGARGVHHVSLSQISRKSE